MGYGTVGSGVVEVINTNGDIINQRAGDEINIKYVLDLRDFPGDPVEIRTYRAIDRQKEFNGILKAYDENTVTIAYEDDTEQTFERADIALIRLALDF